MARRRGLSGLIAVLVALLVFVVAAWRMWSEPAQTQEDAVTQSESSPVQGTLSFRSNSARRRGTSRLKRESGTEKSAVATAPNKEINREPNGGKSAAEASGDVLWVTKTSDSGSSQKFAVTVAQDGSAGTLIHSLQPNYPAKALEAHLQGSVVLAAQIAQTGEVQDVKVVSGDPLLAEAALAAVRHWEYQASEAKDATPKQTQITIDFKLPN